MRIDSIKIKLLLAEKDMTQSDLAEKCGLARQNISAMLARGTSSPAKAVKIAESLGVDAREIIKED